MSAGMGGKQLCVKISEPSVKRLQKYFLGFTILNKGTFHLYLHRDAPEVKIITKLF